MKFKIKRCAIALIFVMVAAACKEEKYHLPEDKMENVLLDIQLAEVYSSMAGYDTAIHVPIKSTDSLAKFYREVLKHHNITLDQFEQSLDWYRQKPVDLDSMYSRVTAKLTKQAKAIEDEQKKKQKTAH